MPSGQGVFRTIKTQRRLDRRLEGVAKAVGGGYCRLQMPLKLALGVRGTVAGRPGGGGYLTPLQCIAAPPPPFSSATPPWAPPPQRPVVRCCRFCVPGRAPSLCLSFQDNYWRQTQDSLKFFACKAVQGEEGPPCAGGSVIGTCSVGFTGAPPFARRMCIVLMEHPAVDTTKTRSDPQRVWMWKGERPIGAAKGKQTSTMASCSTAPVVPSCLQKAVPPPPPPRHPGRPQSPSVAWHQEPPDDMFDYSGGLLPVPLTRCIQMHTPSPC